NASGRHVRRRAAARPPGAAQGAGSLLRAPRGLRLRPRAPPARRARVPAVSDGPRAPLPLDGREYHGTLALRSQGGGVSVVNGLSLDTYLRGVVPSESPSHWPVAALEAQAVAARSYAVYRLRPSSWYDLVPTTA